MRRVRFICRILLVLSLCTFGLGVTGKLDSQEIDPKGLQLLVDSVMQRGELVIHTGEFETLGENDSFEEYGSDVLKRMLF